MAITKERKAELISQFRRAESDSGSPEVQIALLTERIFAPLGMKSSRYCKNLANIVENDLKRIIGT